MVEDQMFYACNALFYGQGAEGWKNAGERKKFAALLEERVKALKGKEDTSGRTMTVGGKRMPVMEYYCQSYEEMLEKVKSVDIHIYSGMVFRDGIPYGIAK